MPKKEIKTAEAIQPKPIKKDNINLLLENSIALQKTMADLALELKSLNQKVARIVSSFESASLAFKEAKEKGIAEPKDISEKLDMIIDQNKTIAQGVLLLEESIRVKPSSPMKMRPSIRQTEEAEEEKEYKPQPLPEFTF